MDKHTQDYLDLANARLIAEVAAYYNAVQKDIEFYRELGFTELEALVTEHLAHWKQRLHELIFNHEGGEV